MSDKRKIFFRIFSLPASVFSVNFYAGLTHQRTILPLYHTVNDIPPAHIKWLYPVRSEKQFKRDLEFFLKHYSPVTYHDLVSGKLKKNSFHLSFDDGLRECYEIIAPVLTEKGIPATFFLNPDFLDNKGLMYRYKVSLLVEKMGDVRGEDVRQMQETEDVREMQNTGQLRNWLLRAKHTDENKINEIAVSLGVNFTKYLEEKKPYMTSEEVNSLIKKGFTIGAHSMNHPDYRLLTLNEQLLQTKESVNTVTEKFNPGYRVFAFPFSDNGVKKDFFERALNEIPSLCDATFGCAGMKKDIHPKHFQRIPVETYTSEAGKIIKFEYFYYLLKAPFGKNNIHR
ncbi:MAG: polysaccharide deacetylase family protein [Bacteroidota bacterium]